MPLMSSASPPSRGEGREDRTLKSRSEASSGMSRRQVTRTLRGGIRPALSALWLAYETRSSLALLTS